MRSLYSQNIQRGLPLGKYVKKCSGGLPLLSQANQYMQMKYSNMQMRYLMCTSRTTEDMNKGFLQ